ncbi:MAG: DEAD/DEAH box helicase family protein [Lentisphaerae bacterium]|nr:DEAD/DEAH box helicase family protein [Lentisphaerota bacterium]
MPSDELQKHIAAQTTPAIWESGRALFLQGGILDAHFAPRNIDVRLANDRGTFERVSLALRNRQLSCRCTCSAQRHYCPHIIAALLHVAQENPEILAALPAPGSAATADTTPGAAPSPAPVALQYGDVAALRGGFNSLTMDALRGYLRSTTPAARLVLSCPDELPNLEIPSQRVVIRGEIQYNGKTYAQGNIKRLIENGQASAGMTLADFDPQMQHVMQFLLQYAEFSLRDLSLDCYALADLFHCLRGSNILSTPAGIVQVHLAPLQIHFNVTPEGDNATVVPRIIVPERGAVPPDRLSFITGRAGFWVGRDSEYWWFPGILPYNWLRLFLEGQPLQLSATELSCLTLLCEQRQFPGKITLSRISTQLGVDIGRVRPVLTLDWESDGLVGDLQFDYGGKRVEVGGEPVISVGGNRFVRRDSEREDEAQAFILAAGFVHSDSSWHRLRLMDSHAIWTFMQETTKKLPSHWLIFWTPQVRTNLAACSEARMDIQAVDEGDSWFSTTCNLKAADGTPIPFQLALEAIHRDEDFIRLPNGAIVKLSLELFQVLRAMSKRASSRDDNAFHFARCHALALADEVAPFWAGPRPNWHSLRDKLQHPETEPERPLPAALRVRLRDYQREGIRWLSVLESCGFHGILADEMGLGKTIQALAAIMSRKVMELSNKPSLVVCPTSLLDNWLAEAQRFTPELRSVIIRGTERAKVFLDLDQYDLIITSYALLRRDSFEYESMEFDYVVLDEAQHIKNPRTANAHACKELKADHRLVLTGTPVENSPSDLWSLFDFLLPGYLGTHRDFRLLYEKKQGGDQRGELADQLASQIRPFILRRTKHEVCAELPAKLEQILYCELGNDQRQLYDNLLLAGRKLLELAKREGWQEHRFDVLATLLRLRQACCHPALLPQEYLSGSPDDMPSVKFELAKEVILEAIDSGHRILLFSQFTSVLGLFPDWLKKARIPYEYMDGNTKDRQQRVDHFNQNSDIPVFLLSLKAGGVGLNLTGADTVIHYDLWWNPMVEDQATDRTHRIGQNRTVTAIKLVTRHTIEEKILSLQDSKRETFHRLLGGAPTAIHDLSPEDVEFLLEQF